MWKINTTQYDVYVNSPRKSYSRYVNQTYTTLIYFHYIIFQVSSHQMLLWNSGTHSEILLCEAFPADETRVNDMAQCPFFSPYLLMTSKHYNQLFSNL